MSSNEILEHLNLTLGTAKKSEVIRVWEKHDGTAVSTIGVTAALLAIGCERR